MSLSKPINAKWGKATVLFNKFVMDVEALINHDPAALADGQRIAQLLNQHGFGGQAASEFVHSPLLWQFIMVYGNSDVPPSALHTVFPLGHPLRQLSHDDNQPARFNTVPIYKACRFGCFDLADLFAGNEQLFGASPNGGCSHYAVDGIADGILLGAAPVDQVRKWYPIINKWIDNPAIYAAAVCIGNYPLAEELFHILREGQDDNGLERAIATLPCHPGWMQAYYRQVNTFDRFAKSTHVVLSKVCATGMRFTDPYWFDAVFQGILKRIQDNDNQLEKTEFKLFFNEDIYTAARWGYTHVLDKVLTIVKRQPPHAAIHQLWRDILSTVFEAMVCSANINHIVPIATLLANHRVYHGVCFLFGLDNAATSDDECPLSDQGWAFQPDEITLARGDINKLNVDYAQAMRTAFNVLFPQQPPPHNGVFQDQRGDVIQGWGIDKPPFAINFMMRHALEEKDDHLMGCIVDYFGHTGALPQRDAIKPVFVDMQS
jgi:hypothetical protein